MDYRQGEEFRDDRRGGYLPPEVVKRLSALDPVKGTLAVLETYGAIALCVGAALKPKELGGEIPALGWNSALRLLAVPLLAYAVARLLHLPTMETTIIVLFFALPTAPTAYVLTRQLGGDSHLMAGIITLQTLLAAASLPLVLTLLER